ncbi:MAG: 1,2-phenylacetyl-CoA epoxidase subunit PaaC, partial [Pseudomonadota bacterium]
MAGDNALFQFLLRQGDNSLVLGHRLSEWCGMGPALEEDIALANTALDLIGQTRLWLSYAGEVEGAGRSEDDLAYLRDAYDFRNALLLEVPNEDFGRTILREFFFDAFQLPWLHALIESADERVAEIAAKSAKEAS